MRDYGMADQNVAWPSYVDFLSSFVFILILFVTATVYLISGAQDQRRITGYETVDKDRLSAAGIEVEVEGRRSIIHTGKKVNFPVSGHDLDAQGRAELRRVGEQLAGLKHVRRIVVQGHADQLQNPDDKFFNWDLSVKRALEVLKFLYLCEDCGYGPAVRAKLVLRGEGELDAHQLTPEQRKSGNRDDRGVDIILDYDTRNEK
jgi:flagellar motor protein MotB